MISYACGMQKKAPPLPMRNGVSPSYIWLPEGTWENALAFLTWRFPEINREIWLNRMSKGEVVDEFGQAIAPDSRVRRGMCIYYYREVMSETPIPFDEVILFHDEHLLVVDKPHFLPVTPGGSHLNETLLVRLKKQLGEADLTPIHRLDRETAGILLLSRQAATRGRYQSLFQRREIKKIYHAIARTCHEYSFPLQRMTRIAEDERFFVMRETEGATNAETWIDVLQSNRDWSLYELHPSTGVKHQLRVHMNALGAPILHDRFYPIVLPENTDNFAQPLQLLAKTIAFIDPISGKERQFESQQSLHLPPEKTAPN